MGTQPALQAGAEVVGIESRWEWRVFDTFPSNEIAALRAPRPHGDISREAYLLSSASPHNAKIRRGVLEVKLLLDAAPGGYELWRPVFKRAFPLATESMGAVWDALSIDPPPMDRTRYTEDEFTAKLLTATPLRVVRIGKCRSRFSVRESAAERAFLTVDAARWEAFAIEDEDLDRLKAARQSVHGLSLTPANYPAWLKHVAGMTSEQAALRGESK